MVTRIKQGDSHRPPVLGGVAAVALVLLQGIAIARIVAEVRVPSEAS